MEEMECSRRTFLAGFGVAAMASCVGFPAAAGSHPRAVRRGTAPATVAYFNDGLLADPTGRLPAHRRPTGYRGARAALAMSAEQRIAVGLPV